MFHIMKRDKRKMINYSKIKKNLHFFSGFYFNFIIINLFYSIQITPITYLLFLQLLRTQKLIHKGLKHT